MLDGLTKWLNVGRVIGVLKVTRDLDAWSNLIFYAKGKGTLLIYSVQRISISN